MLPLELKLEMRVFFSDAFLTELMRNRQCNNTSRSISIHWRFQYVAWKTLQFKNLYRILWGKTGLPVRTLRPCSHFTFAFVFVSNIKNGFYGNKWWCSDLMFTFDGKGQRKIQTQTLSVNKFLILVHFKILPVLRLDNVHYVTCGDSPSIHGHSFTYTQTRTLLQSGLTGVFPKWSRFIESDNHWSVNWVQFKDSVSPMYLAGAGVVSWVVLVLVDLAVFLLS